MPHHIHVVFSFSVAGQLLASGGDGMPPCLLQLPFREY